MGIHHKRQHTNLVEEVNLILASKEGRTDTMHWCITPTLKLLVRTEFDRQGRQVIYIPHSRIHLPSPRSRRTCYMLHHATNLDHRSRNCSRLHIIIIKIYVAITYHKWLTVTPVVSLSSIVWEESHGIVRRHQFRVAVDKLCYTTRLSTWSGRIDSNHKLLTDSHRVGIVFSYSYKDTVKPGNIVCSKPVSWDCITIAYRRPSCYLAYTRKAIEFGLDNQNALKWAETYVIVKVTEKGDIRSRKKYE